MNFFDQQDRARRSTKRLILLYLLSAASIVAGISLVVAGALYNSDIHGPFSFSTFFGQQAPILIGTAIAASLFIAGATLVKTAQLSSGGGRVAQELGGTLVSPETSDPLRSRLRNVVEEMAIASGVPVPEIYVLEHETGINAFAAGYAPGDAAVAVTRGALEMLERDELQGVIGHEFSHILNGDMRINIRLMGILFGIMSIGLMGRTVFRHIRVASLGSKRGNGAPVVMIIGLGLIILGAVGVFFARVIKSGVSRQREYLADASAVQFTRQSEGLANALKKIGGYDAGSHIQAADPEEVSHMLFGTGSKLRGMFATHPPLTERIQALDPNFRDSDYPSVNLREREMQLAEAGGDQRNMGLAGATSAMAGSVSPRSIGESVGQPTDQHVAFAARVRRSVPDTLYDAAHSSELSYLLVVALILDRTGAVLDRQFSLVNERLGEQRTRLIRNFYDELRSAGPEYRLPLLEIAFPALRQRPAPQLNYLIDLTGRLIEVDGEIDLHEFCFYRVLANNLRQVINPSNNPKQKRAGRKPVRDAAVELLRIAAHYGHDDDVEGEAAFRAGLAKFGNWGSAYPFAGDQAPSTASLDKSLDQLAALNGDGREMLLDAITAVVLHDEQLTVAEAELVRAICASLGIPLPPQIGVSLNSDSISGSD
ncbi:MAG: M48 family metalloprotease [Woeseiaceae bacterium]